MSGISVAGGLLGQLAVSRGLVTPEQLRAALEVLGREGNKARLGDILLSQGLVTPAQIQALLTEQSAIQARLREEGPLGGSSGGSGLDLADAAPLSVAKVPLAKKTAAQVQVEIAAQKAAMDAKRQVLDARQAKRKPALVEEPALDEGKIELEIPDDDASTFEIETSDGTRAVDKSGTASRPSSPEPAVPVRVAASAVVPQAPQPAAPNAGTGRKLLGDLVLAAARAMASDLHLHCGYPLMIRQQGRIVQSPAAPLQSETLEPALRDILSEDEKTVWAAKGQVETTFVVPNVARCRVQMIRTAAGVSAVFRLLPLVVPNLAALGLPTTLARFVASQQGLVLVAGPASSGKTWTLAALVDIVNSERREHVVCIERPIEFLHLSKRCVVTQREVPTHARDVSRAVRAALHEDVDVLVIGEIEDAETVRLAVNAAEGGKLVLATVAAAGAARAVTRILGMFPGDQQSQAASMLADALRGVVGQRLVQMADGARRMAVCEILGVDAAAEQLIQAGRTRELVPAVTFDQALANAVRAGQITKEEAHRNAEHPEPFR